LAVLVRGGGIFSSALIDTHPARWVVIVHRSVFTVHLSPPPAFPRFGSRWRSAPASSGSNPA